MTSRPGRTLPSGRALRRALIGLLASLSLLSPAAAPVQAATGNVVFRASVTINNSCSIIVINDGRLATNAAFTQLSSKLAGGLAAVANILSTTNYRISAIATPTFTVAPVGGNTNTVLQSRYSGQSVSRGRTFAERVGTSRVRLNTGLSTTRVSVHLVATRTGSSFPSGNYKGNVTLRCE